MRVLVTGATGLIGKDVVKHCLEQGMDVHYLTTDISKIIKEHKYRGYYWNPSKKEIDATCLQGVEAIIHLAGASISKRWTKKNKRAILSSRVESTQLLVDTLIKHPHRVKHVISASAIGIYPDSLSNYYDESHSAGDDTFLSRVVRQWEAAVEAFSTLKIAVSKIRIGVVLSDRGGVLPAMIKPMRLGLGTAFGSGNAWQSWIHITDVSRIFLYVLTHHLQGVYNAVAPNPVTHQDFIKHCGRVLNKPLWLPNIPKGIMKLVLGDMHLLLFLSQRVSCKKIEAAGFEFRYHHLQPALENLLT